MSRQQIPVPRFVYDIVIHIVFCHDRSLARLVPNRNFSVKYSFRLGNLGVLEEDAGVWVNFVPGYPIITIWVISYAAVNSPVADAVWARGLYRLFQLFLAAIWANAAFFIALDTRTVVGIVI